MIARHAMVHPSRKRLLAWLDTADGSPTVTAHVDRCERCAGRLEELAADPLAADVSTDTDLGDVLREVYAAPDDISDRVLHSIEARARADREIELLLGLFTIAKDAAELMLTEQSNRDDDDGRRPREET